MIKADYFDIPATRILFTAHQLFRLYQKPVSLCTLLARIRYWIRLFNELSARAIPTQEQPTTLVRVIPHAVIANFSKSPLGNSNHCSTDYAANASSMSAMMSSIFSIPTEMRTRESVIPSSCLLVGVKSRCEAVAGCSTLVKTSPRLVERTHNFNASIKRNAASRVFSQSSIETSAPSPG